MRKVGGILLVMAMVLPVGLIASPASAGAPVLTCTKLTGTATFTPPVSPTVIATHKISSKSTISGCTGTPGVTSGQVTFTSTSIKENCKILLANKATSKATISVKWSNGKVSGPGTATVSYVSLGVVKITAKTTAGTIFLGKTSVSEALFLPKGGGCLTAGKSLGTTSVSFPKGQKLVIS
jgi:hypothetical protein